MGPKQLFEMILADKTNGPKCIEALLECPSLRFRFGNAILRYEQGHLVDAETGALAIVDSKNYGGCFILEERLFKESDVLPPEIKIAENKVDPKTVVPPVISGAADPKRLIQNRP